MSWNVRTWWPRDFKSQAVSPPRNGLPQDVVYGQSPLVLEIGAGNGRHAVELARKHSSCPVLAIERTVNKTKKARNRLERLQRSGELPNTLHFIHDDAVNWVSHNLTWGPCLAEISILYPNPYPKASQRNKRFHFMPFMQKLRSLMLPEAKLVMVTNEPDYFLDACEVLPRCFALPCIEQRICDPRNAARTNFEQIFFERGVLCYQATFQTPADDPRVSCIQS